LFISVPRRFGIVVTWRHFFLEHSSHGAYPQMQSRSAENLGDFLFAQRRAKRLQSLDGKLGQRNNLQHSGLDGLFPALGQRKLDTALRIAHDGFAKGGFAKGDILGRVQFIVYWAAPACEALLPNRVC